MERPFRGRGSPVHAGICAALKEMSALLLDTHIWLWYAEGNAGQLSSRSVQRLDEARGADGLLVSSISVWEIGMQSLQGRTQLAMPLRDWVAKALSPAGISLLALDARHSRREHAPARSAARRPGRTSPDRGRTSQETRSRYPGPGNHHLRKIRARTSSGAVATTTRRP